MTDTHPARLGFIDALRGWAFVFMVFNHTALAFLGARFDPARIHLVYITVSLAAPLFLFLVGFSLALSDASATGASKSYAYYLKRGLLLIALGLFVNAITKPDMPVFTGDILQTIGITLMCLAPLPRFMNRRTVRYGVVVAAVALYLLFITFHPSVMARLQATPLLVHLFFDGFPPWPWISVAMIGLVLGSIWTIGVEGHKKLIMTIGEVGICCLIFYFAAGYLYGNSISFDFSTDYIINGHWLPGPKTTFLVIGGVLINFFVVYYVIEKTRLRLTWLQLIGRSALVLYVVHLLLIRVLGIHILEIQSASWGHFAAVNLSVFAVVLLMAVATDRWRQGGRAAERSTLS